MSATRKAFKDFDKLEESYCITELHPNVAYVDRHNLKETPELLTEFAHELLSKSGSASHILAAESLIEASALSSDSTFICDNIALADTTLKNIITRETAATRQIEGHSLKAAMLAIEIPSFQFIALENALPPLGIQSRMYDQLLSLASLVAETTELQGISVDNDFVGLRSELLAKIIAQRFAVKKLKNGEWIPLLTTFNQDQAGMIAGSVKKGWDISVLTQLTETPELSYKIQIKNRRSPYRFDRYDDDIALIYMDEIRTTKNGKTLGWSTTFNAFLAEHYNNTDLTWYLDSMEEKFLDSLD